MGAPRVRLDPASAQRQLRIPAVGQTAFFAVGSERVTPRRFVVMRR